MNASRPARTLRRAVWLAMFLIGATSASAAVTAPHVIAVLANTSALELGDYPAGATVTAEVVRNGSVVGSVTGPVASDGTFNVNPTECWTGFTPVILPGDTVRVTSPDFPAVDETVVRDVSVDTIENVGGTIKVHGTASDGAGNPLPLTEIESRIISTTDAFTKNGRRRIQTGHPGAPGEGTMAYDAPGSTHWTATYAGLSQHDQDLAVASSTDKRGLWASPAADEVTIMLLGAVAGPAAPCFAPLAKNAVSSATPNAINAGNVGVVDVVVQGIAFNADQVEVKITDGVNTTTPVMATLTPGPGNQTWTATIPKDEVAALADGPLDVSGTYFTGAAGVSGSDITVVKDTVVPVAPTATPPPGTYAETQFVQLHHAEAAAGTKIVYTENGVDPTVLSAVFNGNVFVFNTETVKARVIDIAGNVGPVATFDYVINRPSPPPPPPPPPPSGGATPPPGGGAPPPAVTPPPVVSGLKSVCLPIAKSKVRGACRPAVRFTLSAKATVRFVVTNVAGKRVGAFVRECAAGKNTVIVPAKLGGRTLPPGKYTVTVTATAAGGTSAKLKTKVSVPKP